MSMYKIAQINNVMNERSSRKVMHCWVFALDWTLFILLKKRRLDHVFV